MTIEQKWDFVTYCAEIFAELKSHPEQLEHIKSVAFNDDWMMVRNPAPAAIYKALKTGADLDIDKLITLPEKSAIKIIEEKFGKDSKRQKH